MRFRLWHRLATVVPVFFAACAPATTPVVAPIPDAVAPPAVAAPASPAASRHAIPDSAFVRMVTRLSEPGGFFQSGNVVSNEQSYLTVLDAARRIGISGGAYIGVGPDQNYSYIAAFRPAIAFMFDIRRDNLVEHLLFKAIFSMAESRLEYVCILLARECTDSIGAFRDRPVNDIVAYVERLGPSSSVSDNTFPEIVRRVRAIGLPFDSADVRALAAYRNAFVQNGFYVNYSSLDMRPMYNMPGWGALLVARDRAGQQLNYLAADSLFRVVKTMHAENRIVPITGNVAGPAALAAVGDELRRRNETLSVLYMSNVEQYLFQYGSMDAFAQNVAKLPRTNRSVVIRSLFSGGRGSNYSSHPSYVPGQNSTSVMEYVDAFVADWTAGRIPSYYDLLFRASIPP